MWLLLWITLLALCFTSAAGRIPESSRRNRRLIPSLLTPGLCRYGTRTECCYGWKQNSKGQCEAICEQGCKHGECVGPNKCKCFPGFTGNSCSQGM
uniref:EGF-like domain-containing protein n=1 Tax=Engystomops pustulosus TaxID=76066 RepID=A0AAV6Z0F6_ENGPU|nr:hypothetical protein GDO81_028117 [Engystomops pustulosus]KAG8541863.1 hypothetical protein GDO81_028117 [Engystomops pustulosus]